MTPLLIEGFCDPRFAKARDLFAENWDLFEETGASVAATLDGKPILDLWGGWADAARTRPWQADTIVLTASVTKGLTGLAGNMLIDRGLLDPEAPVARYWPEFAAGGKATLPVKSLFDHTAGLPNLPEGTRAVDWDLVVEGLAAATPLWEPGTAHAYHAMTFGNLVGELVVRTMGLSVGQFLQKEICGPLGVDAWIGVGPELDSRVAELTGAYWPEWATLPWRRLEAPGVNAHTNARALARIFGALACGGALDGVRLIGQRTLEDATAAAVTGRWFGFTDEVVASSGMPAAVFDMRFARGFSMSNPFTWMGPNPRAFGSPGAGGAIVFADPEARLGFGYAQNAHVGLGHEIDSRSGRIIEAIYDAL